MSTFSEMVDETLSLLRSQVRDQEMSTHLTASIDADDVSIPVANTSVLSRGRIQIEDELIWIDSASREGTTATVPPYGRGMDGTTAATHASGTRVINQPLYPRKVVKDAINKAILTAGTQLYGVTRTTLTPDYTTNIYEMPATTRDVLSVKVYDPSNGGAAAFLRKWSLDKNVSTTISSTGMALTIRDGMISEPLDIEVVYSRDPIVLSASSDAFTASYLPATAEDLIILLAASRLLATSESYNLQTRSVEANTMDAKVPPGQGVAQSKYLYQLYTQRLAEERRRLLNSTVNRVHYAR